MASFLAARERVTVASSDDNGGRLQYFFVVVPGLEIRVVCYSSVASRKKTRPIITILA